MRGIGKIAEKFGDGDIRLTVWQNFLISGVKSIAFYVDLGFTAHRMGDSIAAMELEQFGFLLQHFYAEGFAGNFMMQLMVNDLDGWWRRIEGLDLAGK